MQYPPCLANCVPGTDPKLWVKTAEEQMLNDRAIFNGDEQIIEDNYFTGQSPFYSIATDLKTNGTLNRTNLPKGLKQYLHHKKLGPKTWSCRGARYLDPIVITCKQRPGWVLTSMQSTGATNFVSTNMFHEITNYTMARPRGKGGEYTRNIESNESRENYLGGYSFVDVGDRGTSRLNSQVVTHRAHINATLGARDWALLSAHDIYLETVTELLPEWKVAKPRSFSDFALKCSTQMCQYKSSRNLYPDDEGNRATTKQSKKRRPKPTTVQAPATAVKKSKKTTQAEMLRDQHVNALCRSVSVFGHHKCVTKYRQPMICSFCGQMGAYYGCEAKMCKGLNFCALSARTTHTRDCHAYFHDPNCDGLGYMDVTGDETTNWRTKRKEFKAAGGQWELNLKGCRDTRAKFAPESESDTSMNEDEDDE